MCSRRALYIIGIIGTAALDDRSRLLAHLTDVTPKVSLPIQVTKHQIAADKLAYKFKPL